MTAGRRIEDHHQVRPPRRGRCGQHRRQRNLKLEDNHVSSTEAVQQPANLRIPDAAVRARRDGDEVLAARFDHDQGSASGLHVITCDPGHVYAVRLEPGHELLAEGVRANPADQSDPGAQPRRGRGLVGTFSARDPEQAVAQHGFARAGKGWDTHHHVHVEAAHDGHAGHAGSIGRAVEAVNHPGYKVIVLSASA